MPAPFTQKDVESIVQEFINNNSTAPNENIANSLTQHILQELKPKTTDYKLVSSVTILPYDAAQLDSQHSLGFLWNNDTDGTYSIKLTWLESSWLLVNVCYIKL